LFSLFSTQSVTDIVVMLITQKLYPDRLVHVELSDGDNNGKKKYVGDDVEGGGASSIE
jgi:hypothetical protein